MVTEERTSGAPRSRRRVDADAEESSEPARTRETGGASANERASAGNRLGPERVAQQWAGRARPPLRAELPRR